MGELQDAVTAGWDVKAAAFEYVPEGGGSHHWKVLDERGVAQFVTVDDLDDKAWFGDDRSRVFEEFTRALRTSARLRDVAGLDFVVAPIPATDGDVLHRVTDRYTVSMYEYLSGDSYQFGPYRDERLRARALAMVGTLHSASAVVEAIAPRHVLGYTGELELAQFLDDPGAPWDGGPFAELAHRSLAERAAGLAGLVGAFDALAERSSGSRAGTVVTHGEPHPANLMTVGNEVLLIDWDTVALGPPERDLWLIVNDRDDLDEYERVTGRPVDPAVLLLYRLRWFLDDVGSAMRMFRSPHADTADTRRWAEGLQLRLADIGEWIERLESHHRSG